MISQLMNCVQSILTKWGSSNLLILLLLIFMGCEYQTDEIYNRNANPDVTPPVIQVVDLNITTDTIYVYGNATVRFKFSAGNLEVRKVVFLIDGKEKGVFNSDNGAFSIPIANHSSAIHDLSVKIYTATGSGSLAEEFDAESFIETRSWKLVYLNQGYNLTISTSIENGLLHLRWNKYIASNFKEYVVYKRNSSGEYTEITRTCFNEFTDSSYVGDYAFYEVKVVADDNLEYSSDFLMVNEERLRMSLTMDNYGQFMVHWNKPKYYNAIDTIILWQGLANNSNSMHRVMATTNPDDTVFYIKTGSFCDEMTFYIRIVPHKTSVAESTSQGSLLGVITGYLGYKYDEEGFCDFFQAGNDGFVYTNNCNYIKRFSLSQRKPTGELKYQIKNCSGCLVGSFSRSNTGKYITTFIYCDATLQFSNSNDLGNYSRHNINNITSSSFSGVSLADNGIALFHNMDGSFDLYNLVSSSGIGKYTRNFDPQSIQCIAPDGSFFTICTDSLRMIEVNGNSFSEIWKIKYSSNNLRFYEFDALNPDQIIFWQGSRLEFRSCIDMSVIRSINLSDKLLLNIDYINNEFLTYNSGHLLVRSLDDGSVKDDIPVNFDPHYWYNDCRLINHSIVSARGVMYFLQ